MPVAEQNAVSFPSQILLAMDTIISSTETLLVDQVSCVNIKSDPIVAASPVLVALSHYIQKAPSDIVYQSEWQAETVVESVKVLTNSSTLEDAQTQQASPIILKRVVAKIVSRRRPWQVGSPRRSTLNW